MMRVKLIKPGYGRKKGAPMDVSPTKAFVMMAEGFVEKDFAWMAKMERESPLCVRIRQKLDPKPKRWTEPPKPEPKKPEPDPEPEKEPEPEEEKPEPKPKEKKRGRPRKKKTEPKAAEREEPEK
jgi:hypothetical protein